MRIPKRPIAVEIIKINNPKNPEKMKTIEESIIKIIYDMNV